MKILNTFTSNIQPIEICNLKHLFRSKNRFFIIEKTREGRDYALNRNQFQVCLSELSSFHSVLLLSL